MTDTTQQAPQGAEEKNFAWVKWLGFALFGFILGVIVLIGFMIMSVLSENEEEVALAKEFIFLNADERYEEAYALTTDAFKEVATLDILIDVVEGNEVLRDATSVEFSTFVWENEYLTLSGEVATDSGVTSPLTMDLVCEVENECLVEFVSLDPEDVPEVIGE